jgi:hypothetical protein
MDILFNFLYLLISAVFVGSVFWATLRLMDRAAAIYFRNTIDLIERNPLAASIYFGCRIIAVAILYSPLLRVIL